MIAWIAAREFVSANTLSLHNSNPWFSIAIRAAYRM
jgi:hypothetical protein